MRRLQRWIAASGAGLIGALALGLIPPARAGGGVGFCADALRPGQADRAWSATLQKLQQGLRPALIADFPCFTGRPAQLSELNSREGYALLIETGFRKQVLLDALRRNFERVLRNDEQLGLQRYQNLAWGGAYLSEAALLAYERSGDERFLELFVAYFDRLLLRRDAVLHRRDDFRDAIRQGWGSSKAAPNRWINLITHNGRIVYPATRFALLVQQRPALQRFQTKANHYTAISRAVLDEFDPEWQTLHTANGDAWFLRPPSGEPEATNRIHLVGRSWMNLAQLSGEANYRQRVEQLIALFLQGVQPQPDGSLRWSYYPAFTQDPHSEHHMQQASGEPIWKATLTVPFLLEAAQQGYAVPPELLQAIARTWLEVMLQENCLRYSFNSSDPRCLSPEHDADKLGMLQTLFGLLPYSQLEPALAARIQALVASRPDLFPGGWLGSPAGAIGYAFFLQPDP